MKRSKRFFNLIEVVLALGVAGLGIAGVMAVIPLSVKAARTADYENSIADTINTFFSQLDVFFKKQFDNTYNSIATSHETVQDALSKYYNKYGVEGPFAKSDKDKDKTFDLLYSEGEEFKSMYEDAASAGFGTQGFYRVWTGKQGSIYPDFTADILIWKSDQDKVLKWSPSATSAKYECTYEEPSDPPTGSSTSPQIVHVYIEVSWPVSVPYENREKRLFVRDYYNPNY